MKNINRKEKLWVSENILNYIEIDGGSLINIIEDLQLLQKECSLKGYKNVCLNIDYDNYSTQLTGERLETDKEYTKRIKYEEKREERAEQIRNKNRENIIKAAKKLGMDFVK